MTRPRRGLISLLASIVLLFPTVARPDGMVYVGDYWSSRRPLEPLEQAATIVQRGGVEKMVIALNFGAEDKDSALWIFPVPGPSNQTKVDVVDCFPSFRGTDPRDKARGAINPFMLALPATQLWPLGFIIGGTNLLPSRMAAGRPSVSSEVEKWGIHAEVISAKSMDELTAYLKEKQAGVEEARLRAFEPYLAGGYVLVTAWMASKEEVLKSFPESQAAFGALGGVRRPALYVEFPSASAYFPLRPTAAYGDAVIPLRLYVAGYVEPRTSPALAGSLAVSYYQGSLFNPSLGGPELQPPQAIKDALGAETVEYTTVSYWGPARNFTDDLHFVPTHPFGMRFAHLVLRLRDDWTARVLVFILLVAGLSYLAGGLAGLLVRRQWHRYALFGLANLLTILGWLAVLRRLEGKQPEFRFFAAFTVTFVVLGLILQLALLLLTGSVGIGMIGM